MDELNPTGLPQVVEELSGGAVLVSYAYGHGRISQDRVASGSILPSFYGYDCHGDVRLLTDSTSAVTDAYEYDSYGNSVSSTGSTTNVYLYQGEQFDCMRQTNPGQARADFQRAGVSGATSDTFL